MWEMGHRLRSRLALLLVVPVLAAALVLGTAAPAVAAPQERAEAVIGAALQYLGRPYRLGGEGPNFLDCSGLVFRAFSDAGQLKAVGKARMRAVGYLRWFERRGLATADESLAARGDLIVYANGEHIGIYLGRGEVVSALTTSGITVHRLHGINWAFSHVLKVDWSMGRNPPVLPVVDEAPDDEADQETASDDAAADESASTADGIAGLATGSLNLRTAPDPAAQLVGVVSRGSDFTVIGAGRSPSGSLWLNVVTGSGASGWIWSQFTELPEGTDPEAMADTQERPVGMATGSLNVRAEPDPAAHIVGVVQMGAEFTILGGAHSPSGWLWLEVETASGAVGWIWSHWTEFPAEALVGAAEGTTELAMPAADGEALPTLEPLGLTSPMDE
jgi:murein DD-endopeptidase